jgi:DnaJ-class molecular chaperone
MQPMVVHPVVKIKVKYAPECRACQGYGYFMREIPCRQCHASGYMEAR